MTITTTICNCDYPTPSGMGSQNGETCTCGGLI